jgi:hypothetical protein
VLRGLALLDEDRLDFELLELLVAHIDEANQDQPGAILVFLPGGDAEGRGRTGGRGGGKGGWDN